MTTKKYLVLGSAGLIGFNLCNYLKSKGCIVFEYDIKNNLGDEDLRIPNQPKLRKLLSNCDFIFFLAFDIGGSKYLKECDEAYDFLSNNTKIICNTFELLREFNKKFVFISSYMANNPTHSYGLIKKLGEYFTRSLNGLVVRLYNVYGAENVSLRSHIIPDLINQAKFHSKIKLSTTGKERRQFLYVEDCCAGLYVISEQYDLLVKEKIVDLTSFEWTNIEGVANIIGKHFNCNVELSSNIALYNQEPLPGRIILNYWEPKESIETGIEKLIVE